MLILGSLNKIQHVSPNQKTPQLLEITMLLILNFCNSPKILSAFDHLALRSLNILVTANDSKRHRSSQIPGMISSLTIILINRWSKDFNRLRSDNFTNPFFEFQEIGRGEGIGFGDDRDQVDARTQTFHDFNVKRTESMACGADKVETGMDSKVNFIVTFWLLFLTHVRFVLGG